MYRRISLWEARNTQEQVTKVKQRLRPDTKALSLIFGNNTRWGGDYDSLVRAFELRDPLEEFIPSVIRRNEDQDCFQETQFHFLHLDELTPPDCDILKEIMFILQPFRKWQLILQSKRHFGQLHDIFPAMDKLFSLLKKSRNHDLQHIRTSVNTAWSVLNM